jgi:hypothetical protein
MRVVNKNEEVTGFLTVEDLEPGEVFRFQDSTGVYLMTDDNFVVNVETGGVSDIYARDLEYRPVERINCHLVIE